MNQPRTLADTKWEQVWVELLVLYAVTAFAGAYALDMHWLVAGISALPVMLAMLLGIMLFVQVLWMTVVGLEKIGVACGMRKSPLA